jgi:hypothetical protein
VHDENIKQTIQKLAGELKEIVINNNESESAYLAKISTMTGNNNLYICMCTFVNICMC